MKTKYLVLVFVIFCISCSQTKNIATIESNENNVLLYKIIKIKSIDSCYVIYAQRNDSIFKIISDKDSRYSNYRKIRTNSKYNLYLTRIFPTDSLFGISIAPNLGVKGMGVKGGGIVSVEKISHNSLYMAHNLHGLCIQK
ncbi:MAG: hypothetical protein WC542_00080 [Paludibacter sp.]